MLKLDKVCVERGPIVTLDEVSLTLNSKQTLMVVGESGAGKSTLIAAILGLIKLSSGTISWNNAPVKICQPTLVIQEPRAAFNPVYSLRQSVMEPIIARKIKVAPDRIQKLCDGLELPQALLDRKPYEVSIGQAQRVGILRALIASPSLVLFDEPLSALDAITQKHTARLISDLQDEEGFAALVVTHDLGYAAAHGDAIAVLKNGQVEECADAGQFIESPKTNYGKELRDAAFALGALGTLSAPESENVCVTGSK
ncbi:MAG: ATP-binding cassette domain-containing protein [Lentilitoribacter sp.]